jgi:hypothetical protein
MKKAAWSGTSQAILSPFCALGLLTSAKSFAANPVIGSARLNGWGLHAARVALAHRFAAARRRKLGQRVSAADRSAFEQDGFVIRENFLPRQAFDALTAELRAYRCLAREIRQGDTVNRKIAVDAAILKAIPALRAVLESPDWRDLIRYIGSRGADPAVFIQTIVRQACEGPSDPQTWLHSDTFHPTAKAWLSLTDVEEDEGAFSYVPGSHRLTPERLDWEWRMSITARRSRNRETREGSFRIGAETLAAMGLPPPRIFAVRANTLIVADMFGFHARGPSAGPSLRVELWALGRRSPFLPWAGLDPWTSAGLGSRASLLWKLTDLAARAGLKRAGARTSSPLSAFDRR